MTDRCTIRAVRVAGIFAFLLLSAATGGGLRAEGNDDDRGFTAPRAGEKEFGEQSLQSTAADPAKAVVIIGLASTASDIRSENVGLIFQRVDPATKGWVKSGLLSTGKEHFRVSRQTRHAILHYLGAKIDPTVPSYELAEINPGEWIMTEMVNGAPVAYHRTEVTQLFRSKTDQVPANAVGPRFKVWAGEVVYLGTFHIDAQHFPAKLARHTIDEDAARQRLTEQPALQGKLAYRAPYIERK